MFDISLSELSIISAVALLVLGPKEFSKGIKFLRHTANSVKKWWETNYPGIDEEQSNENVVKYVMDLEGNLRPSYDLSLIAPEIKKSHHIKRQDILNPAHDKKTAKKKRIRKKVV